MQGLGGAFLEHLVYDEDGQLLTGSLADYLMPTASDFPSIRSVALELKPTPHNPLGAKGAGEGGIIPVGGVVSNAVAAALVFARRRAARIAAVAAAAVATHSGREATHEAILGSTGRSGTPTVYPSVLNNVLGMKFKIVMGYTDRSPPCWRWSAARSRGTRPALMA